MDNTDAELIVVRRARIAQALKPWIDGDGNWVLLDAIADAALVDANSEIRTLKNKVRELDIKVRAYLDTKPDRDDERAALEARIEEAEGSAKEAWTRVDEQAAAFQLEREQLKATTITSSVFSSPCTPPLASDLEEVERLRKDLGSAHSTIREMWARLEERTEQLATLTRNLYSALEENARLCNFFNGLRVQLDGLAQTTAKGAS